MSQKDRIRWDDRYMENGPAMASDAFPLPLFSSHAHQFPTHGQALDLACGRGKAAVWFAQRGMNVYGFDISPAAIDHARELAETVGVSDHCHFEVFDLDDGLPETFSVDLLICHNFRNPDLYNDMQARLAPGGLLALVTLSEVQAGPGRFRAKPGELESAFSDLEKICAGEENGRAWLLARKVNSHLPTAMGGI